MSASNPLEAPRDRLDVPGVKPYRGGAESDNPYQSPESPFQEPVAIAAIEYHGEKLNPWFSMMYRPRDTIRFVIATAPSRRLLLLAWLGGFVLRLQFALLQSIGLERSLEQALLDGAIGGVVIGPFSVFLFPFVSRWTSSLLGGVATYQQMRAAAAWSNIPLVWSLIPWGLLMAIHKGMLFTPALYRTSKTLPSTLALSLIGVFAVWRFIVYFKTASEVNRISTWRAFWAIFFAGTIVVELAILVILGLVTVRALFQG